jgi:transposase-like protein
MNTIHLSEGITYCTGTEFELVSFFGGIHRYKCKKCGSTFANPLTSTGTLPVMHRRDTIRADEMFTIEPRLEI